MSLSISIDIEISGHGMAFLKETFQTLSRSLVVSLNVYKYGSFVFAVSKSYRKSL